MRHINRTILIFGLFVTAMAFAQKGEILVTAKKVGQNINIEFELLNEGEVSGLQFDVVLPKNQSKSLSIGSCTSSFNKSQLAGCSLNGNSLRVAIIEKSLGEISSGMLGSITVKGANGMLENELKVINALLSDKNGHEVKITPILDYKEVSFRKPIDLNSNK